LIHNARAKVYRRDSAECSCESKLYFVVCGRVCYIGGIKQSVVATIPGTANARVSVQHLQVARAGVCTPQPRPARASVGRVVLEEGSYILRHCVVEDNSHLLSYGMEAQTASISTPVKIAPYKNHARRVDAYLRIDLIIIPLLPRLLGGNRTHSGSVSGILPRLSGPVSLSVAIPARLALRTRRRR
jgi:hypothetical protein